MDKPKRFNLRVYAILKNKQGKLLITHERYGEVEFYKFPGGGLEFGEGTVRGLKRELKEELGITVSKLDHLFTTDEFVPSAFRKEDQIISIYYLVKLPENQEISTIDSNPGSAEILDRIWVNASELNTYLRFPMDLKVSKLLEERL